MSQSHPVSAPSLPTPTAHPGFATARIWLGYRRPRPLRDLLAETAKPPPPAPDDVEPDPGDEDFSDHASTDTVPEVHHPVALELTLILGLARAIEAAGRKPGARGTLARIGGWADPAVPRLLETMLATSLLSEALLHAEARRAAPVLIAAPRSAGNPRGLAEAQANWLARISARLMENDAVVLLSTARADLTDELRALCDPDLILPRPDRALAHALMALFFADHPGLADAVDALPSDEALGRLTGLQLTAAFRTETPDAAAARLATYAAGTAPVVTSPAGLDAVAGQDTAVTQMRRLAADIAAWRAGTLRWAEVPRSVIFHGPPGTGKTLLAQAFAAEAHLPLIATSFADCQKAGHMGDMLGALEAAVAEAEARAPSVFFLDEVDGFGSRDSHDVGRNRGYMRAVITGLLRQLDRLAATEGVVVIGATNDLAAIDPAIRRAGRFDATVAVPPPGRAGLATILARHLRAEPGDTAFAAAIATSAERLIGTSGAEAAALARAALARARAAGRALTPADLLAELDARHPEVAAEALRRIALHEAGHVVVGLLSGLHAPLALRLGAGTGATLWPAPPFHTYATAWAQLRTLMAGRAAEMVCLGAPSSGAGEGPASDLAQATALAVRLETEWGMGDGGLIWHPAARLSAAQTGWLRPKLDHLLRVADREARALVATHRAEVEALADTLLAARELDGADLTEALAPLRRRIAARSGPSRTDDEVAESDVIPFRPR
jgi:cell division protease FtsH